MFRQYSKICSRHRTAGLITFLASCLFPSSCSNSSLQKGGDNAGNANQIFHQVALIGFDLSPQTKEMVFSAYGKGSGGIYMLSLSHSKVRTLIDSNAFETTPAYAPNGKTIAYAAGATIADPTKIFICSTLGTGVTQVTQLNKRDEGRCYDRFPSFSPDGRWIVFARAQRPRDYSMGGTTWDQWNVFAVKPDGTALHQVTYQNYYSISAPYFTPDGERIVFAADKGVGKPSQYRVPSNLLVVSRSGQQLPQLMTRDNRSSSPSCFGKDANSQIVFISDRETDFEHEIWRMDTKGLQPQRVTQNHSFITMPKVEAKGKEIYFVMDPTKTQSYELWKINEKSKRQNKIAGFMIFSNPLNWSPATK